MVSTNILIFLMVTNLSPGLGSDPGSTPVSALGLALGSGSDPDLAQSSGLRRTFYISFTNNTFIKVRY